MTGKSRGLRGGGRVRAWPLCEKIGRGATEQVHLRGAEDRARRQVGVVHGRSGPLCVHSKGWRQAVDSLKFEVFYGKELRFAKALSSKWPEFYSRA